MKLVAFLSQHGLHGEIHFEQQNDKNIEIQTSLETTLQYPNQIWSWGVYQFPVDYSDPNGDRRCKSSTLGAQIITFDDELGHLMLPGNESATYSIEAEVTGIDFDHFLIKTEPKIIENSIDRYKRNLGKVISVDQY